MSARHIVAFFILKSRGGVMPTNIDELQIEINAKATKANEAIDRLVGKIDKLTASMSRLDGSKLASLAGGVQRLGSAMQTMNNVKTADFTRLARNLQNLNNLDVSKLANVSTNVNHIGTALKGFSGINFDNKGVQNLINSIARLSDSNISSLANVNFAQLGNNINQLATSLANASKIQQSVISMTNAIGNLAKSGDKIPLVSSSLGNLGTALNKFVSDMASSASASDSTINFANAIGVLAKSGNTMPATTSNLSALGTELKKLMKELSTAPKVSQNLIDMTNALAKLARTGASSGKAANSLVSSFNRISKASKGVKFNLLGAASGIKSLGGQLLSVVGLAGGFYMVFNGIKNAIDISSDLTEVQNVVDVTFGDFKQKIEDLASVSIPELGMSELTTKNIASRFQAMGTAMGFTQGKMADMSVELTRLTGDMASFYNVEQKAVGEDLESIFTGQTKPLRQYGLDLTEATLQEWALKNGIDANINSMSQMEKTMLRYQYVMANTKAAQGDFQRTQDTWANQIRILQENFKALASVMGSSFISALKPLVRALNSAMSHIIAFAKVVSNSLGKIFGWQYEDATGGIANDFEDAAGYADNLASGTGKAADNANKLKQQLQGFHELNVLTSPTDSGSGGGSGVAGGGTANADANSDQWVQTDSILKSYESQLDTLYKLGSHIGETLTNAMNNIDWDSVYEGARNFGSGLASFLNGLISPELFGATGKTIAASLNTALYSLNSFGATFDWNDFGISIGTGINNFFSTFDFKATAETINAWANGILDTIISALDTIDWSQLGTAIGDFFSKLDIADIASKLLYVAGQIITGLGEALLNVFDKSPLSGAIISVIGGLKLASASQVWANTIGSTILNKLGIAVGTSGGSTGMGAIGQATIAVTSGILLGEVIGGQASKLWASMAENAGDTKLAKYYKEYNTPSKAIQGLVEAKPTMKELAEAMKNMSYDFVDYLTKDETTEISLNAEVKNLDFTKLSKSDKTVKNGTISTDKLTDNVPLYKKIISNGTITADKFSDAIPQGLKTLKNFVADIDDKTDNINIKDKALSGFSALLENGKDLIQNKILSKFTADITERKDSLSLGAKTFESIANLNKATKNIPSSELVFGGTVRFDSAVVGKGLQNFQMSITKKANGGLFNGGSWKPIQQFALGGFPDTSQLFIARERGPELVGTIGGHTAVMNNDQIVASVSDGVARAVASVMSRYGNNNTQPIIVNLDGREVFNSTRKYANDYYNRTGRPAFNM